MVRTPSRLQCLVAMNLINNKLVNQVRFLSKRDMFLTVNTKIHFDIHCRHVMAVCPGLNFCYHVPSLLFGLARTQNFQS